MVGLAVFTPLHADRAGTPLGGRVDDTSKVARRLGSVDGSGVLPFAAGGRAVVTGRARTDGTWTVRTTFFRSPWSGQVRHA